VPPSARAVTSVQFGEVRAAVAVGRFGSSGVGRPGPAITRRGGEALGRATQGDRGSLEAEFTAFYRHEAPRIVRTVAVVVRDAALAEDAVAEAFARAWARWAQVRSHERPVAWVIRVALNDCNSRFRRRRVERRKAHAVARSDHVEDPEPPAGHVWEAVARLPERERMLIALRYVADLRQADIAELLGVAPGTVASGLNRGRRRLGIELGPAHDEEMS
jgi:RNA polymerase sigma-70 factor (sigma-E family)